MTKFLRTAWTLTALTVTSLVLVPSAAKAVDVDKLVPTDVETLASVQFKQILEAPILKKFGVDGLLRLAVESNDEAQKIIKATGIDPFRDLDSLTIGTSGNPEKGIKAIMILRGKFDPEKITKTVEEKAKENGTELKKIKEGGYDIWTAAAQGQEVFIAFVEKNAIVASTIKEQVVTALKGGRSDEFAGIMKSSLSKLTGKELFWSVTLITEEARKQMSAQEQFKDIGENLEAITMSLGLTDVAKLTMTGYTKDDKTPGKIKALITDQGIPFAKLMSSTDPKNGKKVSTVLDALKISTKEKEIGISLSVSEDDIRKFINPGE